jgi:argininosuccinate synthase
MEYAEKTGIPVTATKEKPYSIDQNLFHISYEGGILEDPWQEPPADMYTLITPPEKAPDNPLYVEISFKEGNPVAVNNEKCSPAELLARLNTLAGENGIGRVDIVENRYVGMKSRGVYETPGGTLLHAAHRAIESIVLDREIMHMRDALIPRYAELIYNGYWFAPERMALQHFIDYSQEAVEGTVRLKLYKGNCDVVGRMSPLSLYHPALATFEQEDIYDQKHADGFIKLNALRLKLSQLRKPYREE